MRMNFFQKSVEKCQISLTYGSLTGILQGADKSLPRSGRKEANVSVRMA